MQVIDSGHWLTTERDDHVTFAQSCFLSGAAVRCRKHDHAGLFWQIVKADNAAMQRHVLSFDSDVCATNAALLEQAAGNEFGRIDSYGEAEALRAHDGRGIHPNDLAIRRNQ